MQRAYRKRSHSTTNQIVHQPESSKQHSRQLTQGTIHWLAVVMVSKSYWGLPTKVLQQNKKTLYQKINDLVQEILFRKSPLRWVASKFPRVKYLATLTPRSPSFPAMRNKSSPARTYCRINNRLKVDRRRNHPKLRKLSGAQFTINHTTWYKLITWALSKHLCPASSNLIV